MTKTRLRDFPQACRQFLNKRIGVSLVWWAVIVTVAPPAPARGNDQTTLDKYLQPIVSKFPGSVSVAVKHLTSDESYDLNPNRVMPTASLIKLPIMVEVYRQAAAGSLSLNDRLTLKDADKVPGSGVLTTHFNEGTSISVQTAVRLMITFSDNTATNLVLDKIGIAATNTAMKEFGLSETKINAQVFRRDTSILPERSNKYGLGSTTASEMLRLLELLHQRQLVGPQQSDAMLGHLRNCHDESKCAQQLPTEVSFAHKTGETSRVVCDAGIIESDHGGIAICVLTSWSENDLAAKAKRLCGEIARSSYHYFVSKSKSKTRAVPLQFGSSGAAVLDLQRTLNARLKPSPELSIDGDFGPMTQAAVKTFQRSNRLPETGFVDDRLWNALGPIVPEKAVVGDRTSINQESQLTLEPEVDAYGPPLVTCKAWAIGDTDSGELLWSENGNDPLNPASTTKIMTALLIANLADGDSSVWDEIITFSHRADKTVGSTADVRAGEHLSARELLYGLLLPSGNDASVALGEHFGRRFAPELESPDPDPLTRFVAEMNREARRLALSSTHYVNPHGLTADNHLTSAIDLFQLAHRALKNKTLRETVGCRQHGCEVIGSSGYRRNIVWKNTNRLLGIAGYTGVKTGTTSAAGACLVSCGKHGEKSLIVVVLGATSSDARYVDTRNLFRWAWRQLEQH